MASTANSSHQHKPSSSRNQQQQLVSTMIKQGFISDPFLSPSRFNSLSPPPNFRALASPTLSEMMSVEQAREPKPSSEAHKKLRERVSSVLSQAPFQISNYWGMGDVRLTVAARPEAGERETGAFRVSMDVHRRVLASKSRFFAEKLPRSGPHSVEILECDDVVAYLEAVVLMYSDELKAKLMGMEVSKILTLLKISSAIMFDDGIRACLEYLEAVPWSEQEEENVVSHLNRLQLDDSGTDTVLQRVIAEPSTSSRADEIFLKLSFGVLQAKDDKARREMKALIFRLLREDCDNNTFQNKLDISRDTLYHLCHSKITAQLCISIGRGEILVPKETRFALLSTWLEALYDDFKWMRMAGKSVDRKLIEEGLSQTILTLPLPQQQSLLLNWFDRFLNRGDDCPNIQTAFEIWWRRAFVKQYVVDSQLQITVCDIPN
ncbi:BTB/POZ domain-containing protein [Sesamum angolense]|uniref:BTB/POZ domain-containing protein n=1 Tax=Sesamum angolense TaxID=2727404 RepID=A0AAE1XCB2_9LAMI|nr:BTB/POZ domain-containing protein [Sesamum angolense]